MYYGNPGESMCLTLFWVIATTTVLTLLFSLVMSARKRTGFASWHQAFEYYVVEVHGAFHRTLSGLGIALIVIGALAMFPSSLMLLVFAVDGYAEPLAVVCFFGLGVVPLTLGTAMYRIGRRDLESVRWRLAHRAPWVPFISSQEPSEDREARYMKAMGFVRDLRILVSLCCGVAFLLVLWGFADLVFGLMAYDVSVTVAFLVSMSWKFSMAALLLATVRNIMVRPLERPEFWNMLLNAR